VISSAFIHNSCPDPEAPPSTGTPDSHPTTPSHRLQTGNPPETMNSSIIITTIQPVTESILKFSNLLPESQIILVGDRKTPPISNRGNIRYIPLDEQKGLGFRLAEHLPVNHYVRKNLGYLYAARENPGCVYDTDDDNTPYDDWAFPDFSQSAIDTVIDEKTYNVYSRFTDEHVWPRGFPLTRLASKTPGSTAVQAQQIGVWQGLADLDPDVDAIHRLVFNREITFTRQPPVALSSGCYCPFNSQNTLWSREMLAYAYLPATVSFRFTDILRGYVAQRCFWEHNRQLGFTGATVFQHRNTHDLLQDLDSEIPVYLQAEKVINLLDSAVLRDDPEYNLTEVYKALRDGGIVEAAETELVDAWIRDIGPYL
jgi:hypothetical protein